MSLSVPSLQENVEETKRGIVGGVQNSLCSTMDMLKFVLVLIMPQENMFGVLVILSFVSVCLGALSLTSYAVKEESRESREVSNKPHGDSVKC